MCSVLGHAARDHKPDKSTARQSLKKVGFCPGICTMVVDLKNVLDIHACVVMEIAHLKTTGLLDHGGR